MKPKFITLLLSLFLPYVTLAMNNDDTPLHPSDSLVICRIVGKEANCNHITIGGKSHTIGDTFRADQKIEWTPSLKYIEVENKRTWEPLKISSEEYSSDSKKFYSCYIKRPITGTKGTNIDIQYMKEWLSQTFYILDDYLIISSTLVIDYNHTYILEPLNHQGPSIKLDYDKHQPFLMYISKEQLKKNNTKFETESSTFRVLYVDLKTGKTNFITDKMKIEKY